MKVVDLIQQKDFSASFEFFPPKTEQGSENLFQNIKNLMPLNPSYVSVTYGAGGSTQELTHELILRLQKETQLCIVSHLTCVGHTKEQIHEILEKYNKSGIENILALRGDPPLGQTQFKATEGGFNYASDMVAYIKKNFPNMGIGVAGFPEGHPETPNRLKEMEYLKAKVDAGADYICTQLFFSNKDYYDFCERCEIMGIHVPIIAGIMPITSKSGLKRMADLAGGANFPAPLLKALARAQDDEGIAKVGIHWATEQVRDLIDNKVKGIHFYTLNQSLATVEICKALGINDSQQINHSPKFF